MAAHGFGIMPRGPAPGMRFDEYAPARYGCIFVDDDQMAALAPKLAAVELYWHTVDNPQKGLAYCGVTLIPPEKLPALICKIADEPACSALLELLGRAKASNRYVIHFGI